jgi:hypothetical protein
MPFLSEADQDQLRSIFAEQLEFPELSRRFHVMGVPKTVINATQELVGAQPEARLLAAIRAALGSIPACG